MPLKSSASVPFLGQINYPMKEGAIGSELQVKASDRIRKVKQKCFRESIKLFSLALYFPEREIELRTNRIPIFHRSSIN